MTGIMKWKRDYKMGNRKYNEEKPSVEDLDAERFEDQAHGNDEEYYQELDHSQQSHYVPGMGWCNDGGEPYGYM